MSLFKSLKLNLLIIRVEGYERPLNIDKIHKIKPITITTAIIPTTAPALNIPAIASQLLKVITKAVSINKFNFFMGIDVLNK